MIGLGVGRLEIGRAHHASLREARDARWRRHTATLASGQAGGSGRGTAVVARAGYGDQEEMDEIRRLFARTKDRAWGDEFKWRLLLEGMATGMTERAVFPPPPGAVRGVFRP